jgi:hypothetical protein
MKAPRALWLYLALVGSLLGLLSLGVGGLGLHLTPLYVAIWLCLVVGLAAGREVARRLLMALGVLLVISLALGLQGHLDGVGSFALLAVGSAQMAILFSPSLRQDRSI